MMVRGDDLDAVDKMVEFVSGQGTDLTSRGADPQARHPDDGDPPSRRSPG
jgi:hypothetical protein